MRAAVDSSAAHGECRVASCGYGHGTYCRLWAGLAAGFERMRELASARGSRARCWMVIEEGAVGRCLVSEIMARQSATERAQRLGWTPGGRGEEKRPDARFPLDGRDSRSEPLRHGMGPGWVGQPSPRLPVEVSAIATEMTSG